ncbi:MAG: GNAT family N-acetyltransferase [Candidatus Moranbacteria bacterium]|nr:GNAT family N-acetyltransferase [Candidatus Moranbacteria bacterium]
MEKEALNEKTFFEKKENLPVDIRIFTKEDFLNEKVYKGSSVPQDPRFFPKEQGGVFQYIDFSQSLSDMRGEGGVFYLCAENSNVVVGIAELEKDPNDKFIFWLKGISVDSLYVQRGVATILIENVLQYVKDENVSLKVSSYSSEGEEKLRKKIEELAREKQVVLVEER